MIEIYKEFVFDAAHWLPLVPEGHKCARLHGHTYRLIVWCSGEVDERGFIVDYAEIADAVRPVLEALDHHCLNANADLDNPTTEVMIQWIWKQLKPSLPQLCRVEVKESATTGCVYSE